MFKQTKNIETAFQHIRTFSLLIIVGSLLLAGFGLYRSYQLVSQMQSKIYVLANGKAFEANSSERTDNVGVEARDHVKTFHQLFFTLDPDDKVIKENLSQALYLADQTAKQEYDNLQENGYYTGIISGNISQTINIDSVIVSEKEYPYPFRCYATQQIIRTTSKASRSLITSGYLRSVSRSDNNPHGFLIERWTIIENKDLKTEAR